MANRPGTWVDTRLSAVLADTVAQQFELSGALLSDTLTVDRLIGRLRMMPNDLQAQVTGGMNVDLAIGVASETAFDLGTTGTPDVTDVTKFPPRGWLYKSRMWVIKDHATGTASEQLVVDTLAFDLRAARKFDKGSLYVKFESNTTEGGTTYAVRMSGIIRAYILT